jgi:hypothetical protein
LNHDYHTLDSTNKCQTDTTKSQLAPGITPYRERENVRVATGRLDEGVARLDATLFLGLLDHAQGNAILDTAAGIEVLQFGVHGSIDSKAAGQTVEANKGCIANLLGDGIQGHWWGESIRRHYEYGCHNPGNQEMKL